MSTTPNHFPSVAETETFFIARREDELGKQRELRELSRVIAEIDVETLEGDAVPAGTVGTIVGTWNKGDAYDVEFAGALGPATIAHALLRSV